MPHKPTITSKQTGQYFEQQACNHLINQGLRIIATNYTAPFIGEIDIIATDDDTLIFVEVKARKKHQFGTAVESVTRHKQRKIINTANHFLQHHHQYIHFDCRFDVIGFDIFNDRHEIHWIPHAFLVA